MYGEIFAKSDLNDLGSGKTMRVWSDAEKLTFSVNSDENIFVIQATCYEQSGIGDVTRNFQLQLDKDEVEKLVEIAISEKLLKKMAISNLAKIDKASSLELLNEQLRADLAAAKKQIAQLDRKIKKAAAVLASEA